jgi:hypothetical protein
LMFWPAAPFEKSVLRRAASERRIWQRATHSGRSPGRIGRPKGAVRPRGSEPYRLCRERPNKPGRSLASSGPLETRGHACLTFSVLQPRGPGDRQSVCGRIRAHWVTVRWDATLNAGEAHVRRSVSRALTNTMPGSSTNYSATKSVGPNPLPRTVTSKNTLGGSP